MVLLLDVEEGCDDISVHCPNTGGYCDNLQCIMPGVNHKNVIYGMNIDAMKGFNDLLIIGSELKNIYLDCKNVSLLGSYISI